MRINIPKLRTWHLVGLIASGAAFVAIVQYHWSIADPGYAVLRQLHSLDPEEREKAAFELGRLRPIDRRAIGPLTEALYDDDANVRDNAAHSLATIVRPNDPEAPAVKAALALVLDDEDSHARLAIAGALAQYGPRPEVVVPTLVDFARGGDSMERGKAATTLGLFARESESARDALLAAVVDTDHEVRWIAINSLARSALSPSLAPESLRRTIAGALLVALDDDDPIVRQKAVEGLGRLGEQSGEEFPRIIKSLDDTSAEVRYVASCWLGGRRMDRRAARLMPTVARALTDPDQRVRWMVASTLAKGRFGLDAEAALPALRDSLEDPVDEVREEVARAIEAIEKASFEFRSQTLPEAITELGDHDPVIRALAASRLESLGPKAAEAVPALVRCLADPEGDVRHSAAGALGQLGPRAAVALPILTTLASSDADDRVRRAATLARSILLRDASNAAREP